MKELKEAKIKQQQEDSCVDPDSGMPLSAEECEELRLEQEKDADTQGEDFLVGADIDKEDYIIEEGDDLDDGTMLDPMLQEDITLSNDIVYDDARPEAAALAADHTQHHDAEGGGGMYRKRSDRDRDRTKKLASYELDVSAGTLKMQYTLPDSHEDAAEEAKPPPPIDGDEYDANGHTDAGRAAADEAEAEAKKQKRRRALSANLLAVAREVRDEKDKQATLAKAQPPPPPARERRPKKESKLVKCKRCALEFDKAGGCDALNGLGGDPKSCIPKGCGKCAPTAMQYCDDKAADALVIVNKANREAAERAAEQVELDADAAAAAATAAANAEASGVHQNVKPVSLHDMPVITDEDLNMYGTNGFHHSPSTTDNDEMPRMQQGGQQQEHQPRGRRVDAVNDMQVEGVNQNGPPPGGGGLAMRQQRQRKMQQQQQEKERAQSQEKHKERRPPGLADDVKEMTQNHGGPQAGGPEGGSRAGGGDCEQLLEACYSSTEECILNAGGELDDDAVLCKCLLSCLGSNCRNQAEGLCGIRSSQTQQPNSKAPPGTMGPDGRGPGGRGPGSRGPGGPGRGATANPGDDVCVKCAADFDKLGGCHALATKGDPKKSIPVGCEHCASVAMLYCQSKPDAGDRVKPAYAGTPRELAVMEATGKQEAVEAATRTGGGINAGAIGNGGQDGGGAGLNPGVANAIKHKGLKDAGFSPDYLKQQAAALKRISNGALQRGGVLWNPLPPLIQRWVDRDMKILQEPHARLKIGITLAIEPGEQSVFVNGAKQASFFLFETLAPRHEVVLINLDFRGNVSSASEDFNSEAIDGSVVTFEEALKMDLHVVIEEGMQLSRKQLTLLKASDTKVTSFRTGNDYIFLTEQILFRSALATLKNERSVRCNIQSAIHFRKKIRPFFGGKGTCA